MKIYLEIFLYKRYLNKLQYGQNLMKSKIISNLKNGQNF